MNKVASTIVKNNLKNLITFSEFNKLRSSDNSVLTVEINKQPTTLLKNSLWVGYRNGGMASWLSTLLPHLSYTKFCLYMDQDSYKGSEYMYSYYSQYFSKLFHKQFIGTCIHPRKMIKHYELDSFDEIKANKLQSQLAKNIQNGPTVFLDLRGSEVSTQCEMKALVKNYKNSEYINLPLNDEDLLDLLESKTRNLPQNTKFITMCAKGYRSLIGYSLLRLVKKPSWEVQLCRSPISQIKQELRKPIAKSIQFQPTFGQQIKTGQPSRLVSLSFS